jgi:DNA topoisomerase-1
MQQEAGRKLRFTSQRTMSVAQQLYEGLDVGEGGPVGLITYMRTDSTQVAASAVTETREYVATRYGREFRPEKPRVYSRRSKAAQEAHEAIRPTSIRRDPASMKPFLNSEQLRLYTLVWERMLASQMSDAVSESTTVDIDAACRDSGNVYNFRATGSVLKFAGFRSVYLEGRDENSDGDNAKTLPRLEAGDPLSCEGLAANQHFTEPPPRFTEATLIKAMEERGIGRPSTYAPTIGTLLGRYYVERKQSRLFPTVLGLTLSDLLTEFFPGVMDLDFTAGMEEELDAVSRGERGWVPMLGEFYGPFREALDNATETMPRVRLEEETDEVCDDCSKPMVIKIGRFGRFMSCTGYPDCKGTKPILNKIGVTCPDCGGDLVERRARGRGGRPFWGCSRYPACEFILNRRPVPNPCPECGKLMVQHNRSTVACTSCSWQEAASQESASANGSPEETQAGELVNVGD